MKGRKNYAQIIIKKIMLLIAVTLLISMLYFLFVGIDFEIFEYQFSSRLRKFILIILVGCHCNFSGDFSSDTNNRLLTPSIMGLDAYLFIKVLPVFYLEFNRLLMYI